MRLFLMIVTLSLCSLVMSSQTSTMLSPTSGSTSVAISQQIIRIKFDKPIEPTSVWNRVPVNDTSHTAKSGVYVLPAELFDSLASSPSDLKRSALRGDITIDADSVPANDI